MGLWVGQDDGLMCGEGVGKLMVKLTISDFPIFPKVSLAYMTKLCEPFVNAVKVVFPKKVVAFARLSKP